MKFTHFQLTKFCWKVLFLGIRTGVMVLLVILVTRPKWWKTLLKLALKSQKSSCKPTLTLYWSLRSNWQSVRFLLCAIWFTPQSLRMRNLTSSSILHKQLPACSSCHSSSGSFYSKILCISHCWSHWKWSNFSKLISLSKTGCCWIWRKTCPQK